jgi:FtsP/CotA-like multicopper oxidase with cupredoxin domain
MTLLVLAWSPSQAQPRASQMPALGARLPAMPDAGSPVTLRAVNDPRTGLAAFSFAGHEIAPVLHARPGSILRVDYENVTSTHSTEICVDGPCSNMTNLHFHGLHVSPNAPQDDVLSMMASHGESLHYEVQIPADQPPGLYWYHTHPHGESYQQSLDGMSGTLIVDGIERYAPEVRSMRQQIFVLRDAVLKRNDTAAVAELARTEASNAACGSEPEGLRRLLTPLWSEVRGILSDGAGLRYVALRASGSPSLRNRLAAAARERPMNGTVLIATEFHGFPPGWVFSEKERCLISCVPANRSRLFRA